MMKNLTVSRLAKELGIELIGLGDGIVDGVGTLEYATSTQLSFLANPSYRAKLTSTHAAAVILSPQDAANCSRPALVSDNPYAAWAKALQFLYPQTTAPAGIADTATIDSSAVIDPSASVGHNCIVGANCVIGAGVQIGPQCVLEDTVEIGAHTRLVANVFIGQSCRLGQRVLIHPGVVIGADGFGLAMEQGHWQKVPQLGVVVIGNDCEVGANTTIDRGALGDTVLSDDVRIDNQVQIAHNVFIGAHTAIAGCVGIAGSTHIGSYCMIAGASGIGGHLHITDKVVITAMSTVVSSIHEPGIYGSGIPAQPHQRWKRILVRLGKLDDWISRIKKLEKGSSNQ